jgi:signal peptidase II
MKNRTGGIKQFWWIPLLIVLADQATKLRVRHFMNIGDSFRVWGDFFRITYVTNTGAAFSFSLGTDLYNRIFFTITTLVATGLLLFLLHKTDEILPSAAFAMIIGGAIGNLIDRIAYGAVVDFLDFDFFDIIIERWPVFNVADSMITIAVVLLIIDTLRSIKRTDKRVPIPE